MGNCVWVFVQKFHPRALRLVASALELPFRPLFDFPIRSPRPPVLCLGLVGLFGFVCLLGSLDFPLPRHLICS